MKKVIKYLENTAKRLKEDSDNWNGVYIGKKPDWVKKKQKPLLAFHNECIKAIEILKKNMN